jgi:N-acylneuraminate cytidylyltransferase
MFQPENKTRRSQDLQHAFHDSGQFYWIRTSHFLKEKTIFMSATGAIELSELEGQDIDSHLDWIMAEIKYAIIHNR